MPTLQEQIEFSQNLLGTSGQASGGGSIYSGGFFSDVLDTLSIPFYGVAGALDPNKTVFQGIKTRATASSVLNVKNPFAAFAVDVLFDPLTYTGVGALTKLKGVSALKKGGLAATLAGQSAEGQRALLTAFGKPIIKGEAVFKGLTQGTEFLKQTSPQFAGVIEKLGGRGALTSLKSFSPEAIEGAASNLDKVRQAAKFEERARNAMTQRYIVAVEAAKKETDKIAKKLGVDSTKLGEQMTAKHFDNAVHLTPELDDVYTKLKGVTEDMGVKWGKVKKDVLEGYKFPSVLKEQVDANAAGFRLREIGAKSSKEKLRKYTGFTNGVDTLGGRISGGSVRLATQLGDDSAELVGKQFLKKSGDVYMKADDLALIKKGVAKAATGVTKLRGEASILTRLGKKSTANIKQLEKQISKLKGATNEASIIEASVAQKQLAAQLVNQKSLADSLKTVQQQMADLKKATNLDEVLEKYKSINKHKIFKPIEISIDDRNALYSKFSGVSDAFEKDVFKLQKVRAHAVAGATARSNFTEYAKSIGKKVKGGVVPPGYAKSTLDDLKGFAFPEEVVKHMDATYVRYQDFEEVGKFFAAFDKTQNLLKGVLTYLNPAFHSRNVISNLWNMSYAMPINKAFTEYVAAFDIQRKISKGVKGGDAFALLTKAERLDVEEMVKLGVVNTGAFTSDIKGLMSKAQDNIYFNASKEVGATLEDMGKIGMYRHMKKQGFAPKAAANEVFKYLFDYGDLTSFERNTLKRALPFYTWSRKNLPLQLAMLVQKPGKFTQLNHFKQNMEQWAGGGALDEKYMPEWLKEAMPIYLGTGADGLQKFIKLEGFIPAVDINLLSRPIESIFEQFTPLIKTPAELVMNYDTFMEQQMSQYPGQKERFMGVYVSPASEKLLSTIRPLNEVNKLLGLSDIKVTPSFGDRLMSLALGKTYDFNLAKQRSTFNYQQQLQAGMIEKDMKQARSKGSTRRVQTLQEELRKVKRGENISL